MQLNGKKVDLAQLGKELTAAGVAHRALYGDAEKVLTYDTNGEPVDFTNLTAAQAVLTAHVPTDHGHIDTVRDTALEEAAKRDLLAQIDSAKTVAEVGNALRALAHHLFPPR